MRNVDADCWVEFFANKAGDELLPEIEEKEEEKEDDLDSRDEEVAENVGSESTSEKEETEEAAHKEDTHVVADDSEDLKLPLEEGTELLGDNFLRKDSLSPGLVDEDISSAEVSDRDAIDRVSPMDDEGPLTLEDLAMLGNQSLHGLEEQFAEADDGAVLLSTHIMHDQLSAITEENSNCEDDRSSVDRLLHDLDRESVTEDDLTQGNRWFPAPTHVCCGLLDLKSQKHLTMM